jgi:8-oxo-dGTP pyrophosphatase MutT (NUDIX family)
MVKTDRELLMQLEKDYGSYKRRPDKTLKMWEAAVLLPLVKTPQGLSILFEVRSPDLSWQPGDICFPGGHRDPDDANRAVTAGREMEEELGISSADYEIFGPLDYFYGYNGPVIYPFVGFIIHPEKIRPGKDEVAEVFTVTIEELLNMEPQTGTLTIGTKPDPGFPFQLIPNYSRDWRTREGYKIYFYQYGDKVIWGITGRILYNFLHYLKKH